MIYLDSVCIRTLRNGDPHRPTSNEVAKPVSSVYHAQYALYGSPTSPYNTRSLITEQACEECVCARFSHFAYDPLFG